MCNFFSAISDGKGKVLFFKLEDIEKIEKENNPKTYEWNSHTSIAHHFDLSAEEEDKWNKWEYNCEKKELKVDDKLITKDDSKLIKPIIEKYIAENNAIYLHKIYCMNSGNWNSGNRNSGNWNSGNRNSGNWNSGNRNSGDRNSGNGNSGDRNSGNWNSGNSNSGNWNSGNGNSGDRNSGNWNSGYRNSGNWNSGNWNSGYLNTKNQPIFIFNKKTEFNREYPVFPEYFYFEINIWIPVSDMTGEEKNKFWWYKTTDGYLRKIEYKESWKLSFDKASKEDVMKTLKLPNFDYELFEEITGISKKMIEGKLEVKNENI